MIISIIVALADRNVIGAENRLLWHLPDDLKNFKRLTMGKYILMGRKTWESIGRPLPGRTNVVITRNKDLEFRDIYTFNSVQEALNFAENKKQPEIFIIGGEQIYQLTLPLADKLYVTKVYGSFEGDAFFPEIDMKDWIIEKSIYHEKDEIHTFPFEMIVFSKKSIRKQTQLVK